MKQLYGAFDLHSSNNYLGISDERDQRVYKKRLPNRPEIILAELAPYRDKLVGVVVESTFNWYWLVDLLMDEGYRVHLANPAGIQKYKGLKHSDDNHDAFWLAHLLRLGILPEGYIYPKEERPVKGSAPQARALGEAENLFNKQPAGYHPAKLRSHGECQ